MHPYKDDGQLKEDYAVCQAQATSERAISSSVSFTSMANKWVKGVLTDELSDCMEEKGWEKNSQSTLSSNDIKNSNKNKKQNTFNLPTSSEKLSQPEAVAPTYAGTGFMVGSKYYVITNSHVVRGAKSIKVKFLNGEKINAEVLLEDFEHDIAFLKLELPPHLPPSNLKIGDSSKVGMGDRVFTIGYPAYWLMGQNPKYTEGVVNALSGIKDDARVFQVSVQIQPGNSGGPLFNKYYEVIGMTQATLDSEVAANAFGTLPQNVNYAVKSNYISRLMQKLPETFVASRGIVVVPTDSEKTLSSFVNKAKSNIVLIEVIN